MNEVNKADDTTVYAQSFKMLHLESGHYNPGLLAP